jgi:hypothetical protein
LCRDTGKTIVVQPRAHRFVVVRAEGLVRFRDPERLGAADGDGATDGKPVVPGRHLAIPMPSPRLAAIADDVDPVAHPTPA